MQQNKLQELTDKLYQEGLSKGKQEAEEMIARAKSEEQKIIAHAKEQAEEIIMAAKKEAEAAKVTSESEIKLAARQTMAAVKQAIESIIVSTAVAEPVKSALSEKEFLQKLLLTAVGKFDPNSSETLSIQLSEDMQQFARETIQKQLAGNVEVKFSKNIKSGFTINHQSGGYAISFTGEAFQNLFSESLRPPIRKLLFGE